MKNDEELGKWVLEQRLSVSMSELNGAISRSLEQRLSLEQRSSETTSAPQRALSRSVEAKLSTIVAEERA